MAENRMELFIETLTGTAFELSCSPFETIVSIKAKIQYSEGIPVSQQHLIWKSQELNDDLCLQDYQITDGATLKLVLGMRGGPINTRQISDSKKLKDISDSIERRTDTSGSGGRPLTVLVFHDGDKVHMYTLMERGECTISPVSGGVSDTSSVASSKHIEELDQELIRENEITKEKISQLQEQIRALNINRSKRFQASSSQVKENITPPKTPNQKFHLPPINRIDTSDSQTKHYFKNSDHHNTKNEDNQYLSEFSIDRNSKSNLNHKLADISDENEIDDLDNRVLNSKDSRSSSILSGKVSLKTPSNRNSIESTNLLCSSFLPYIEPVPETITKKPLRRLNSSNNQCLGFSLSSSCLNPIAKYNISKVTHAHTQCPLTSSEALSARRYHDLDHWIQNRPRTTPADGLSKHLLQDESLCKNKFVRENRLKQKLKRIRDPLSISLSSGEKDSLLMETYANHSNIPYEISSLTSKSKPSFIHNHSKTDVGAFLTNLRALKEFSPCSTDVNEDISKKSSKNSPKPADDSSRPNSGRKLPLIKAKKKSYKRCSLCSKKTGLATSYICRCGKNFCAPHRYAEVHHCSYDYKTEGRRMLQLNNPVVTASKLPKI